MYGKGSVTSNEMNQHKSMAGADQKGNFGVKPMGGGRMTQPGVKSFEAMNDGSRAAPPGLARKGGGHAMQAAPDHGDMGKDSYRREGKA